MEYEVNSKISGIDIKPHSKMAYSSGCRLIEILSKPLDAYAN